MLKNSWKTKLIAMILIFTLTFSNFALVGKTYAASILDIFSDDENSTGSDNVEFDANFVVMVESDEDDSESDEESEESDEETQEATEETEESSEELVEENIGKEVEADVNVDTLKISLSVNVQNSGYLKDAKIILGNGEELNFAVDTDSTEEVENLQSIEDDSIELSQMNADSEFELTLPISYDGNSSYVELETISKDNVIRFEGTYVDGEDEITVEKEVTLSLSWQDNRETSVETEVTKYISYTSDGVNGVILQMAVTADNTSDDNVLPVESSTIEIEVPTINGVMPESINVVANSLIATTAKAVGELSFSEDNYSYDSETNTLTITVENESEMVLIQDEEEVLIDETEEEVEAYAIGNGTDEYLITYVYSGVSLENVSIDSNVTSTFNMYGDTELVATEEKSYDLVDEIGDIVTFLSSTNTESISKGYTYLNYNNEDNKYEIEIDNELIFNISYKDIVSSLQYEDGTNYYVTASGESYEQSDIYYKSITIDKDNFDEMLGESGYVNIYDAEGNLLATVNNETEVADSGDYEISFDSNVKWIRIETSSPIANGNLVFSCIKAYTDTSFDKETYKTFSKISINGIGKAGYTYLSELTDCGTSVIEITLEDTTTDANIVVGQDSLSTLAMNNNVEIRIELNNDDISSDVYGESEFLIEMPEYVEKVEITDYSMVYGEGLEISEITAYEEDGTIYIRIHVDGEQTDLSSGIITNGTNIVLNANVEVDLYAPSTTESFELLYVNSEATSYASVLNEVGYSEEEIEYSAPSGVVAVNSISNFNSSGETVTSVEQGTVVGDLDLYGDAKIATMELVIMNNEENDITNISILGRTIFAGNTDILTGEDLGTTLDAVMTSEISYDGDEFTIYYSTNETATNDLDDAENGWTTEVDDWSQVKSYLIVPNDSSYVLEQSEKLSFSYEFYVPGNLAHNEDLYGTFGIYYTNNTSVATLGELEIADLVGISTGVGPELEAELSFNKTTINEFEEFETITTISNVGEVTATNIEVVIEIPEYVDYDDTKTDDITITEKDGTITYTIEELEVGEEIEITSTYEIEEMTELADDETGTIEMYAEVTADDLGTTITTNVASLSVNQAELSIIVDNPAIMYPDAVLSNGDELELNIYVENLTSETIKNAVVTMYLDDVLTLTSAYTLSDSYEETEVGSFDSSTRIYTYTIDEIEANGQEVIFLKMTIGDLTTVLSKTVELTANVQASGTESYTSKSYDIYVGQASLSVKQTTTTTNSYVSEGDSIEYIFSITNEGSVAATATLTDEIPDGLTIRRISYVTGSETVVKNIATTLPTATTVYVAAGDTVDVTVTATANNLDGVQELSVTNVGTVSASNVSETVTSNSITHIVEADETSTVSSSASTVSSNLTSSSSLTKTYNITGVAWLDSDENGARDEDEETISGIEATLVDSDTGTIKQTTTTDSNGEYKFSGVSNGNYIVIFDYDTVSYTVTTYQKDNVASNVNSDVISTRIEQDGSYRYGAVTDVVTISSGSISNIDIGLIEAMKFDLSLEMGITKITVQNTKGTSSTEYDMSTLTKTEVSQRYLSGSEIYVEYTFVVTNEGEVAGYATEIVDYIPDGMTFNSSLNTDWYTGTDGNLYTTVLSDTEIAAGETKTFTLVLSKTMTDENTGRVSNTAEISDDYNIYGISDIDSTPGNNDQDEDDFARADAILGVGTGSGPVIAATIVVILIGTAVAIYVIRKKKKNNNGDNDQNDQDEITEGGV